MIIVTIIQGSHIVCMRNVQNDFKHEFKSTFKKQYYVRPKVKARFWALYASIIGKIGAHV